MNTEKSKDNRLVFITELVWKNWQVLLYAFDRDGKMLSFPSFCAEAEKAVLGEQVTVGENASPAVITEKNWL